jgi:hypothetical protein
MLSASLEKGKIRPNVTVVDEGLDGVERGFEMFRTGEFGTRRQSFLNTWRERLVHILF